MIQYTAWQMTIGSIILFVYTSCMETGQVHWTPMAVACLAYNGILASALAFFLWNYVLTCMEASKALSPSWPSPSSASSAVSSSWAKGYMSALPPAWF